MLTQQDGIKNATVSTPKTTVKISASVRRCSQRKCNLKLSPVAPVMEDENVEEVSQVKKSNLKARRSKRSLTAERDRSNPLSVKVLRRCHTQNITSDQIETGSKITLPLVKNIKATK